MISTLCPNWTTKPSLDSRAVSENFRYAELVLTAGSHRNLGPSIVARLLCSQTKLRRNQLVRPAAVPMFVGDGDDHHFIRMIQAGYFLNAPPDGLRRTDNGAARAVSGVGIPPVLRQELLRLLNRRNRNQSPLVQQRAGHAGAGSTTRQATGVVEQAIETNFRTDGEFVENHYKTGVARVSGRWDADHLEVETRRELQGKPLTSVQIWFLSSDARTLTVKNHIDTPKGGAGLGALVAAQVKVWQLGQTARKWQDP